MKIEIDEKDLRRIKKSARRKAMKKDKIETGTRVYDNKSKYTRKKKYTEWNDTDD